jgi:hypothetical protein
MDIVGRFVAISRAAEGATMSATSQAELLAVASGSPRPPVRVEVRDAVDAVGWDADLLATGGSVFHSSVWGRYVVAETPNAIPQFLTYRAADGTAVARALGFLTRSPRPLFASLTQRFGLDAFPASVDTRPEVVRPLVQLTEEAARRTRALDLRVGSLGSAGRSEPFQLEGFTPRRRLEFEVDLARSETALWQGLDSMRRRNIGKSRRVGVTVRDMSTDAGVTELRRLQGATGQRITRRGGPDIRYRGADAVDPVRVLVDSGVGRILGAELDGVCVSAVLFTYFNGLVYHLMSGHSNRGLQTQAPTYLFWESILRYRSVGAHHFSLGGCSADAVSPGSPEHGVYFYKRAFGGECRECVGGTKPLRLAAHRTVGLVRSLLGRGS